MGNSGYDAFWSYTHDDNSRAQGRVLELAAAVQGEFEVTTAQDLKMFVDRDALQWGEAWKESIESALAAAPFFIPIITPKYFASEACRNELAAFSGMAKSRGLEKLMLPILYIKVDDLNVDSADELKAIVARTQYVDWTSLRLKPVDNLTVLEAVEAMAVRLRELQYEVHRLSIEQENKTEAETVLDLEGALSAIAERLKPWMESVDFDKTGRRNWNTFVDERLGRAQRLTKNHNQSGAFSTYIQLGKELLPIALDRLEKARSYSRLTIELDPFVNAALRLLRDHDSFQSLLDPLRDGVREAQLNIEPLEERQRGYGLPPNLVDMNKHIRAADDALLESMTFANDGNVLVLEWVEKFNQLDNSINPE